GRDLAVEDGAGLRAQARRQIALEAQVVERRLGDVQLGSLGLVVGPGVDALRLDVRHLLADVLVLEVKQGAAGRDHGDADRDDPVERELAAPLAAAVFAAAVLVRLVRTFDRLVDRVSELLHARILAPVASGAPGRRRGPETRGARSR